MFKIDVPNKCSIFILTNARSDAILYSSSQEYMFDKYNLGGDNMQTTTANKFTVLEGGLSVNEILRKSRVAAARRRRMKKIRIISFIVIFIAVLTIIIFSNVVRAEPNHVPDSSVKGYTYITVSDNDTLWGIACEYADEHYSSVYQYIREVKTLNGLTGDAIYSGYKLIIPVYVSIDTGHTYSKGDGVCRDAH